MRKVSEERAPARTVFNTIGVPRVDKGGGRLRGIQKGDTKSL